MLKTLHGKLSLFLFLILVLIGLGWVQLASFTTRAYIREVNQNLNRALASHLARSLSEKKLLPADLPTNKNAQKRVGNEISRQMALNPDIEIYLLDTTGRIVLFSSAPGNVKSPRVNLEPVRRFGAGLGALPIFGDDPRDPNQRKIFSAAPFPAAAPLRGSVYIILGGQDYDSVAAAVNRSYVLRQSFWVTLGSLVLVFGLGALFFRVLTRRLRALMERMEKFQAAGFANFETDDDAINFSARGRFSDEIDHLGQFYAQMARTLGEQIREKQKLETSRRELISNVSHDLRTPLAALRGYLETVVMKRGQISEAESARYLEIAVKHAKRMEKLVEELFELSKLDSPEVALRLEEFSLPELLQDVVQEFALVAQQKGVVLEVNFAPVPFVRGDIGLIERALENPLENALRHTPEGGTVRVGLEHRSDKNGEVVIAHIADNGVGIAPEDLPHIFERSFRASKERSQVGEGAGLGLAITKRILELHGGRVEVQSAPGQGTTLSLLLPLKARD